MALKLGSLHLCGLQSLSSERETGIQELGAASTDSDVTRVAGGDAPTRTPETAPLLRHHVSTRPKAPDPTVEVHGFSQLQLLASTLA